jgi:hypothetical protein
MKAKRVTGESAQRILLTHVFNERCHVRGCTQEVVATRNPDGVNKQRACIDHVRTQGGRTKPFNVTELLKLPWE